MEKQEGSSSPTHEPPQLSQQTEKPLEPCFQEADVSKDSGGESVEHEEDYISGIKFYLLLGCVTLVGFLFLLDVSIVSTAIPKITTQFHSLKDVGWYGSAYLLANSALQPLTGKIYTHLNSKWVYLTFLGIFELGSLICGAAQSSKMLIIGRAISGMGGAGLLNGAYTIVTASIPIHKAPVYVGILMGVSQFGMLLGPVLGGILTEYSTWRWCKFLSFFINLPCGGLVAILIFFIDIPNRAITAAGKQSARTILGKLDLIGFALFAPAAIQLILALQWGGNYYPWNSAKIIGLFCGSFGTITIFLAWEYRVGDEAMIPLSIIGRRVILSTCLNMAFVLGCLEVSAYYLPIYFQAVRNASPTSSGVDLLPPLLSNMVFLIVSGGLMHSVVGYYLPFGVLGAIFTIIGAGLLTQFSASTTVVPILAMQNNSLKEQISITSALLVFFQNFGATIFLTLSEVSFNTEIGTALVKYAPDVDPETVIVAGVSAVRSVVPEASLHGVLVAYSKAFDYTRYVAIGTAVGAFLTAFGMGWKSVKKPAREETEMKSA